MQRVLDGYKSGIQITQVQMQKVDPPRAGDRCLPRRAGGARRRGRAQNEAQTYANKVVPDARGRSAQILQAAEAYREQTVAEAGPGQASRFTQVFEQYKKAPDITRQRLYLETMEKVLGGADKIILDASPSGFGSTGVVPVLPLNEITRQQSRPR